MVEIGSIFHRLGIEQHQIGKGARPDGAAIGDAEHLGNPPRHLVDGGFHAFSGV